MDDLLEDFGGKLYSRMNCNGKITFENVLNFGLRLSLLGGMLLCLFNGGCRANTE